MDTTVTVLPAIFSFNCNAASIPVLSSGLIILGTPSLIRVPVFGSILTSTVSGTCLIHTTIFIIVLLPKFSYLVFCNCLSNLHRTGDDHLHSFRSTFIDFCNFRISHCSFNWIFTAIAITTKKLYANSCYFICYIRSKQFTHSC